ncbi:hypothetical protein ACS2CQ_23270 [Bacillus cereus group sp. BceL295]
MKNELSSHIKSVILAKKNAGVVITIVHQMKTLVLMNVKFAQLI